MGYGFLSILLFSYLQIFPHLTSSHPLCTDSRAPLPSKTPLAFCPYNGSICCDTVEDLQLQKQFQAFNASDSACASLLKSILCAKCDQFSAELFRIELGFRQVPILCNSTISVNSSQSKSAAINFCGKVWDTCENVSVLNSPFSSSILQGRTGEPINSSSSKLTDLWQSKSAFCEAFGGSSDDESVCFNGEPVKLYKTDTLPPPSGMCLERIENRTYFLTMAAHPDGSNRIFFADLKGRIWLATVPEQGSKETLGFDMSNPFLDITDEVYHDTEFGVMGMAFHPNFVSNGRFFVSFNCDKAQWPDCSGRCSCNSDVGCDPSKLSPDNGARPCQYHAVIAEFSANSTTKNSLAERADPSEVRRIFTIGLPFTTHHGGQILFGPEDGYLYFMMGDGGSNGDPYNFSQNKKSLLGKIMRLDVDNIPSAKEIEDLGLWGNYTIPRDNPYIDDKDWQPEIWALGLRNPWRCSFDSERPSYFICADVGEEEYEEVDLITKGGNYGWRVYEGPSTFHPKQSPGGNTSASSINPIFPIMGYYQSNVNKNTGASVIGGNYYRSETDPCLYGRYLYADLYAISMWAGTETPKSSGNFTSDQLLFDCVHDSPIPCIKVEGSSLPSLGYILSFGEDNNKDVFILSVLGVYRVVPPSRCNYMCSKEIVTNNSSPVPGPSSSSPSSASWLQDPSQKELVLLLLSSFLLLVYPFL